LTFAIISKGGSQKIPEFPINDRIVLQPHTWYTCPANKKAIVKGRVQCTDRGAAASAQFLAAGTIMFQWNTAGGIVGDYLEAPRSLTTGQGGQFALFDIELAAAETIETDQNTGTNAEFNIWMKIQESPA